MAVYLSLELKFKQYEKVIPASQISPFYPKSERNYEAHDEVEKMTDEKVFTQFNPRKIFYLNFTLTSAEKHLRLSSHEQRDFYNQLIFFESEPGL